MSQIHKPKTTKPGAHVDVTVEADDQDTDPKHD